MIIEELLSLVQKRVKSKGTSSMAKAFWRAMERNIKNGMEGRIGLKHRKPTDEDLSRWARNCALLSNGLNPQWMPLSPRTTITEARKKKKKALPRAIHNWMMLASPNEWTRDYLNLLEGSWKRTK